MQKNHLHNYWSHIPYNYLLVFRTVSFLILLTWFYFNMLVFKRDFLEEIITDSIYLTHLGNHFALTYFFTTIVLMIKYGDSSKIVVKNVAQTISKFQHIIVSYQTQIVVFYWIVLRPKLATDEEHRTWNTHQWAANDLAHAPHFICLFIDGLCLSRRLPLTFSGVASTCIFGVQYQCFNFFLYYFYGIIVYAPLNYQDVGSFYFGAGALLFGCFSSFIMIVVRNMSNDYMTKKYSDQYSMRTKLR